MTTNTIARASLTACFGVSIILGGASLLRAYAAAGDSQPEPKGKISPWAAIKSAAAKVPGRPLNANFELDEGKWVYGVMIVSGATIKEVTVDPMTGKAGDVETVTPEDEAKEIKDELTKAIGGKTAAPAAAEEKPDEKAEKTETK